MSTKHPDVNALLARVRQGDQEAIATFVATYDLPLKEVIRHHIDDDIRQVVDSQDILQSVWRSFFTGELSKRQLYDAEEILRILRAMAKHKTLDANRRQLDAKRSVRRTISFERLQQFVMKALTDHHATAAAELEAEDEFEALLRTLTPRQQRILTMRRDGYTHEEIAKQIGCAKRTVERTVERILDYFQRNS
jgi:RNA polymerase sigma factor (sigma-70 family)